MVAMPCPAPRRFVNLLGRQEVLPDVIPGHRSRASPPGADALRDTRRVVESGDRPNDVARRYFPMSVRRLRTQARPGSGLPFEDIRRG
jgi:hypothetical protein